MRTTWLRSERYSSSVPPARPALGRFFAAAVVLLLLQPPVSAFAQEEPQEPVRQRDETSLLELFKAGGIIGYTIVGISCVAFAISLELFFSLRRSAFSPHGLAEELHETIGNGQFTEAAQLCLQRRSLLSAVVRAGLQEISIGYSAVEKAMEEAAQYHGARLYRRIELLSVIASLATMLGLLGTVVGLIRAFKRVAEAGGMVQASDLATGIYQALVTTVEGLLVAIPCLALFALLRNRLDQLVAETLLAAEYAFAGFRRTRARKRADAVKTRSAHTG